MKRGIPQGGLQPEQAGFPGTEKTSAAPANTGPADAQSVYFSTIMAKPPLALRGMLRVSPFFTVRVWMRMACISC